VHASPLLLSGVSIQTSDSYRGNARVEGALAAPEDVDLAEFAVDVATDVVVAHERFGIIVVHPGPTAGVLGRRLLAGIGGGDEREESNEEEYKDTHFGCCKRKRRGAMESLDQNLVLGERVVRLRIEAMSPGVVFNLVICEPLHV
jgi:hypothetical protein